MFCNLRSQKTNKYALDPVMHFLMFHLYCKDNYCKHRDLLTIHYCIILA